MPRKSLLLAALFLCASTVHAQFACLSLGTGAGNPGRPHIAVEGDGSLMFNIQELETAARLKLNVKLFVLNNDGYASIRASQEAYFGSPQIGANAATGLTVPNLSKIANSYGIPAVVIKDQTNLREEVRKALAIEGPVVIDVNVIPDESRSPRLQSYQRPDGTFVSKPLEDLFPFLSREEFLENMIVKPLEE